MGKISVIGVAGASGSGKTTIAEMLRQNFGEDAVIISEDWYYKDTSHVIDKSTLNFDEPQALDHDLLIEHIQLLRAGKAVNLPSYNYKTGERTYEAHKVIKPTKVIIIEGIFTLDKSLIAALDEKIYVHAPKDIALARRLPRDLKFREASYEHTLRMYPKIRQGYMDYIKPTKKIADFIVDNSCETPTISGLLEYLEKKEQAVVQHCTII